jgi:hypothetical protein
MTEMQGIEDRIVRLKNEIRELQKIRFSETTLQGDLHLGEAIEEKREALRQLELILVGRKANQQIR